MIIRTGLLRKRATVQVRTTAQNSYGEHVETWTTIGERWIELEPLSSIEIAGEPGQGAILTHRFSMRKWSQITHECRFLIDGNYYYVASVYDADQRGINMAGMCRVEAV